MVATYSKCFSAVVIVGSSGDALRMNKNGSGPTVVLEQEIDDMFADCSEELKKRRKELKDLKEKLQEAKGRVEKRQEDKKPQKKCYQSGCKEQCWSCIYNCWFKKYEKRKLAYDTVVDLKQKVQEKKGAVDELITRKFIQDAISDRKQLDFSDFYRQTGIVDLTMFKKIRREELEKPGKEEAEMKEKMKDVLNELKKKSNCSYAQMRKVYVEGGSLVQGGSDFKDTLDENKSYDSACWEEILEELVQEEQKAEQLKQRQQKMAQMLEETRKRTWLEIKEKLLEQKAWNEKFEKSSLSVLKAALEEAEVVQGAERIIIQNRAFNKHQKVTLRKDLTAMYSRMQGDLNPKVKLTSEDLASRYEEQ